MPGALLTDRSVREFREWLKTMPPSRFERRVTGACDASLPEQRQARISPQRGARILRFLHGRLNDADFDRAAEWVAGLIDEKLVEGDDGYRGNGHGHS
jgi:hypothetical protein